MKFVQLLPDRKRLSEHSARCSCCHGVCKTGEFLQSGTGCTWTRRNNVDIDPMTVAQSTLCGFSLKSDRARSHTPPGRATSIDCMRLYDQFVHNTTCISSCVIGQLGFRLAHFTSLLSAQTVREGSSTRQQTLPLASNVCRGGDPPCRAATRCSGGGEMQERERPSLTVGALSGSPDAATPALPPILPYPKKNWRATKTQ
jgi:hypothetical protein